MAQTNFLGGLLVDGIPTMGVGGTPLFTGRWIFVDAVNGLDGNSGTSDNPLQTLTAAYALGREGYNDVIVLKSQPTTAASTTGTFRLSAQLAWAKSALHLIGMTAPGLNQRARISTATGATANIANLVNVTGQGCYFSNFSLFQGVGEAATAEQLWQEAGQRNQYSNVFFGGMGSANGAGVAGSYTLKLYGAGECRFNGCYFGVDTQSRSAANTNILIRKNASNVASTRNEFFDCTFAMYATAATPTFIDGNESGGMDRHTLFKNCTLINSGTTALTAGVAFHASQGGFTVMDNCTAVNITDWTASDTAVVQIAGPQPSGELSGIAVNADAT